MADPPIDDLALIALRYAAGELNPEQAAEFEDRMAADPDAREALGEAIRLSAAALQQPVPSPDPLFRSAVREMLRPTVISRIFPRRPYRGHPLAWAGLGATAAIGLFVLGVELGRPSSEPTAAQVPPPAEPAVTPASPEVLATMPRMPAVTHGRSASGSLAASRPTDHPGRVPNPVHPTSGDSSGALPMTSNGPAIAADPPTPAATGQSNPVLRDPKAGMPEPDPSPSLVLPGTGPGGRWGT